MWSRLVIIVNILVTCYGNTSIATIPIPTPIPSIITTCREQYAQKRGEQSLLSREKNGSLFYLDEVDEAFFVLLSLKTIQSLWI